MKHIYPVNLSLKGQDVKILFTPDTCVNPDGVTVGSRLGRGLRLAYDFKNYARWWYGFGRQLSGGGFKFGPLNVLFYPGGAYHIHLGKFGISLLTWPVP